LHTAGGTERATVVIANELAARNYKVGIVCLANKGKPFFETHPNIQLYYLYHESDKQLSFVRNIFRGIKLRQLYKNEKPDIIIIVGSGHSFLNIPAARGITTITWEHFNINVNRQFMHPLSRKIATLYSDRIVTLTNQDAENYKKKFGVKNVICIPNPITINNTNKSPLTEKRVLAIGRLTNQKGFDLLLDAWSQVENRNNGWKLRIIGSGRMLPLLLHKIRKYNLSDSIELIPSSDKIVTHFRESSIYVMSSRYEGLPLVLIEAMAMGLPIISFDCQTGPRDIIEDNLTGRLIPYLDVNRLAKELDNLMGDENKRKLLSENAIKRAENFELKVVADKWEKLFKKLKSPKE
jgi:glycosyltransferase involved in cell wall biosynthesis